MSFWKNVQENSYHSLLTYKTPVNIFLRNLYESKHSSHPNLIQNESKKKETTPSPKKNKQRKIFSIFYRKKY